MAIEQSRDLKQFPLVTVQPFHKPGSDPNTLLKDINKGSYDDIIVAVAKHIKSYSPQKVIIRWGHEMDLCLLYDWSSCVSSDYIAAYRRVVDLSKKTGANNIIWMWSPAGGNSNTDGFYPGKDYVDLIGITGLVSEDWDRYYGNTPVPQPFLQVLLQRYVVATKFQKPLMVAELGLSYSDPKVDRTAWMTDALTAINNKTKFPLLVGWVYFNEFTKPNPHISLLPDFRLTYKELFDSMNETGGLK